MVNEQDVGKSINDVQKHNLGPHGLGDPDDRSLRKVELDIMIPKKMREKARQEKCVPEVQDFNHCCKASGVTMVFKCREQNAKMKECLTYWYQNPEFQKICREEYLKERAEYRKTGLTQKQKLKLQNAEST